MALHRNGPQEPVTTTLENNFQLVLFLNSALIDHITSGPLVALLLVAENSIEKAKNLLGDENPAEAKLKNPTCLRGLYGSDTIHNGFHVSETTACVVRVCFEIR